MAQERDYPSIDLAYEWARPSYDWMLQRLEAASGRVQHVQAFAATLTFAAPVVVKPTFPAVSPTSIWFLIALGLFLAIVVIGLRASVGGTVELADPIKIRNRLLRKTEFQFKADLLLSAANASEHNASLVEKRGRAAIIMSLLLVAEVLMLVVWVVTA